MIVLPATLRSGLLLHLQKVVRPSYRRVLPNNDLANSEAVKAICHNFFNFLNNWRNNMPVQMIELEEVQTLNINDDKLEEIVTKSKTQYSVTNQMYGGSGCC